MTAEETPGIIIVGLILFFLALTALFLSISLARLLRDFAKDIKKMRLDNENKWRELERTKR